MPWAIPWPCLHEFFAVTTHPRIYDPPTTPEGSINQIDAWLESPNVSILAETHGYWPRLREIVAAGNIQGARIHDAKIAALCMIHGVKELWSADRDFSRFPSLKVRNPLIG
jgi:predicted nucleic acid-binding protein